MKLGAKSRQWLLGMASMVVAYGAIAAPVAAQDLPRVSAARALRVGGLTVAPHTEDLLGLSRVQFQGLIAAELAAVGYRLADTNDASVTAEAAPPLNLLGYVREEICDDEAPSQCRITIQWELQDPRSMVVYRTSTRAFDQAPSLEKLRRGLIEGALRSLLQRRRFALQLTEVDGRVKEPDPGPLGFKRCRRPALALPRASRTVAASLVFVEAGSSLTQGAIVSGDGLILTNASTLDEKVPLHVRFSAEQTLSAKIVALDRAADVALLRVAANTDTTCLPLRESALEAGSPIFGISSELGEEHAISLSGGVVQRSESTESLRYVFVDPLIARAEGGPVLDDQGQLAGVVTTRRAPAALGSARALASSSALAALHLKPAPITDSRLLQREGEAAPALGYIHDHDDPPFVLTKRYTYGTSTIAHRVRVAGLATAGVGAVGVAGTWLSFRSAPHVSPSAHQRVVVLNDIAWTLLGVGALGFGVSYALPESHDIVAARSASRDSLFIGIGASGIQVGGRI